MKSITTKKLLFGSLMSFLLGFGTLTLIRFKTASTPCYQRSCAALDFLHQWITPLAAFLVVLSVVLIIAAVVIRLNTPKPQRIAAIGLMAVGSFIFMLSQWKLSNLSYYYDRHDVALYGTLVGPFGGLLFLLGFVVLYCLTLEIKSSSSDDRRRL